MTKDDFILHDYEPSLKQGTVKWESPSNIALVKYWGKKTGQIPENPSISFTLSECKTITEVTYTKKEGTHFSFEVYFEGEINKAFKPKIETFFTRIVDYVPFLRDYHFRIDTKNTFPHSSGIASSASGMSALALCLISIEKKLFKTSEAKDQLYFRQKASFLARLGSGSACRSIDGPVVVWGKHDEIKGSSDLIGAPFQDTLHENFKNYRDAILLVDKGEKQVSSSLGHDLMFGHPFAKQRFIQASDNLSKLKQILITGNIDGFIDIVESEALTLHAMMMTSSPYFILMKPNTLHIINAVWDYRKATGSKLCFTLDAGANVHLLYPDSEADTVYEFINEHLVAYCQNGHYICDTIGKGASKL